MGLASFQRSFRVSSRESDAADTFVLSGTPGFSPKRPPGTHGPWPAEDIVEGRSPSRGGYAGYLEMAETVISTMPLEMIPKQRAGHRKSRGVRPCPDVQTHFHGNNCPELGGNGWSAT